MCRKAFFVALYCKFWIIWAPLWSKSAKWNTIRDYIGLLFWISNHIEKYNYTNYMYNHIYAIYTGTVSVCPLLYLASYSNLHKTINITDVTFFFSVECFRKVYMPLKSSCFCYCLHFRQTDSDIWEWSRVTRYLFIMSINSTKLPSLWCA